jgi:hypothetical protein
MRQTLTVTIAVVLVAASVGTAAADSLNYILHVGELYIYQGVADDGGWDVGDTLALTGMDYVYDTSGPNTWSWVSDKYSATWTCIQATSGLQYFMVASTEGEGWISWAIDSSHDGSGTVRGPEYVPEPATTALFSVGLMGLGAGVWRRKKSAS